MRRGLPWLSVIVAVLLTASAASAVDEVTESGGDRRVSRMGPDGDDDFGAFDPVVAHDPGTDRFLIVWSGNTEDDELDEDELEVWSQLVDGDGESVGEAQRISTDDGFDGVAPAVAFDRVADRYLVVWLARPEAGDDVDVRARSVGLDGVPVGDSRLVSSRTTSAAVLPGSIGPTVAADPTGGFVAAWVGARAPGEFEVWARPLDADAAPGGDEQRVSVMGPDDDTAYVALSPAIAADPAGGFVVAWSGDTDAGELVDGEFEVWARRLGVDAAPTSDQQRVSVMGPDGDASYEGVEPDVAVSDDGVVVVVWSGDTDTGGFGDDRSEIWARPLGTDLSPTADAVAVSDSGADGDALVPALTHNVVSGEFLATWIADPGLASTVDDEVEVWARRLGADGRSVADQQRVSAMGPDGDPTYEALATDVAHGPRDNAYLATWSGDTSGDGLVDDELEVFAQVLDQASAPTVPRNVVAGVPGPGRVTLVWEPPEYDGGSDITGYRISTDAGPLTAVAGSVTSVLITGLAPGEYTLGVEALNVNGVSPLASSAVIRVSATGYWLLETDGTVYPFGNTEPLGSLTPTVGVTAVDIVARPDKTGYWVLDSTGGVTAFGLADAFGSVVASSLAAGEQVSTLSPTPTGQGYWVFTNRGRAVPFGDAADIPDLVDLGLADILNGPIIDSVATPSGQGYYMIGSDGGVFSLGDAEFHGSMGGVPLNQPVNGIVPDPDGVGYWLVAGDGGVFSFEAEFAGSMGSTPLNAPVVGMVAYGDAYLMVGADGGVFNFSDLPFVGSLGDTPPDTGIVAIAA